MEVLALAEGKPFPRKGKKIVSVEPLKGEGEKGDLEQRESHCPLPRGGIYMWGHPELSLGWGSTESYGKRVKGEKKKYY